MGKQADPHQQLLLQILAEMKQMNAHFVALLAALNPPPQVKK